VCAEVIKGKAAYERQGGWLDTGTTPAPMCARIGHAQCYEIPHMPILFCWQSMPGTENLGTAAVARQLESTFTACRNLSKMLLQGASDFQLKSFV